MDRTLDEDPAPVLPQGSKSGRNESRKMVATLLNNLCAASLIGALLQPALSLLRHERTPTGYDMAAAFVIGLIGLIFHAIGRAVAAELED